MKSDPRVLRGMYQKISKLSSYEKIDKIAVFKELRETVPGIMQEFASQKNLTVKQAHDLFKEGNISTSEISEVLKNIGYHV